MQQKIAIYSEGQPIGTEGQSRAASPMRVLYLTAFEQPIGSGIFESQVKRYLCKLADAKGTKIRISQMALRPAVMIGKDGLSFPFLKERAWFRALKQEFAGHDVNGDVVFVPLLLPRRWSFYFPLPVLMIVLALSVPVLFFKQARRRYHVMHCRSYVSTLCALLVRSLLKNFKVVFDMRGFYPEEGLLQHTWKQGSLSFKLWKRLERYLTGKADHTIALSDAFRERVRETGGRDCCTLIYAGTDVSKFREAAKRRTQTRAALGFRDKKVFAYSGGLGSWHDPAMLAKLGAVLDQNIPSAALLVLTPHERGELEREFLTAGVKPERVTIMSVTPAEVPQYLCAADFGIVPLRRIEATDPAKAVGETMIGLKVAEYMAAGLPIIVNERVSGLSSLMAAFKIGIFFNDEDMLAVVPRLKTMIKDYLEFKANCRTVSEKFLSLDIALQAYYGVYRAVFSDSALNCVDIELRAATVSK